MTEGTRWQFVGFVAALVVLHFVLRYGMGLGNLSPDLVLVAVLLTAQRVRPGRAAGIGFFLGVLVGAVSGYSLGADALALTVLGFLGARLRDVIGGESPVVLALYLFAGKWLYDLVVYLALATTATAGPAAVLLLPALAAAVYAALAGVAAAQAYRAVV